MNVATFDFDLLWRLVVIGLGMAGFGALYRRGSQKIDALADRVTDLEDYLHWQFGPPEAQTDEIPAVNDETAEVPKIQLAGGARVPDRGKRGYRGEHRAKDYLPRNEAQ